LQFIVVDEGYCEVVDEACDFIVDGSETIGGMEDGLLVLFLYEGFGEVDEGW
jgi:hypothetical protein